MKWGLAPRSDCLQSLSSSPPYGIHRPDCSSLCVTTHFFLSVLNLLHHNSGLVVPSVISVFVSHPITLILIEVSTHPTFPDNLLCQCFRFFSHVLRWQIPGMSWLRAHINKLKHMGEIQTITCFSWTKFYSNTQSWPFIYALSIAAFIL